MYCEYPVLDHSLVNPNGMLISEWIILLIMVND